MKVKRQRKQWQIPDKVLIPLASKMQRELGRCVENWVTYELEKLRELLGPQYSHVPLDDLRSQVGNLRRQSLLGSVKGHGPGKVAAPSKEMREYYASDHWKQLTYQVRHFWGGRCALCYSDRGLEVHHRTYVRWKNEHMTDLIAVCHNCHKVADQRRQREKRRDDDEPDLF